MFDVLEFEAEHTKHKAGPFHINLLLKVINRKQLTVCLFLVFHRHNEMLIIRWYLSWWHWQLVQSFLKGLNSSNRSLPNSFSLMHYCRFCILKAALSRWFAALTYGCSWINFDIRVVSCTIIPFSLWWDTLSSVSIILPTTTFSIRQVLNYRSKPL